MRKRFALLTLMLPVSLALVWAMEDQRAEFHQTYQLSANGRVAVHNVNGAIQVSAWDRNEVKVDAIKHGRSQQELDEARIVVEATAGSVEIRTKYPDGNHSNHASVEYTITVPRGASLEPVESVNGAVSIDGVAGKVRASSVNGKIDVRRAEGDTDASTVNGRIDAAFDRSQRAASFVPNCEWRHRAGSTERRGRAPQRQHDPREHLQRFRPADSGGGLRTGESYRDDHRQRRRRDQAGNRERRDQPDALVTAASSRRNAPATQRASYCSTARRPASPSDTLSTRSE